MISVCISNSYIVALCYVVDTFTEASAPTVLSFGEGYKTHIQRRMRILVFYAIYRQLALVLVPVYFIKHLVPCYIYYI